MGSCTLIKKFINVNKTTEYTEKCSTESLDCKKITGCNVTSDLIGQFKWCALERGVYVKVGHSRLSCAPSWFIVYIVYHPIFNFKSTRPPMIRVIYCHPVCFDVDIHVHPALHRFV